VLRITAGGGVSAAPRGEPHLLRRRGPIKTLKRALVKGAATGVEAAPINWGRHARAGAAARVRRRSIRSSPIT